MSLPTIPTPEERARVTFELADLGIKLMRQNLRRQFPQDSDAVIEQRLVAWLDTRPGAEHGDAWGRSSRPDADAILRRHPEVA